MVVYDTPAKTPDSIIKLPRHFKFFKNETYTVEYKKSLLDLFKIKIHSKRRDLGKNYIEVVKYEKPVYKYDKSDIYYEFKNMELETDYWYNSLSSKARWYVSKVDDLLFNRLYMKMYNTDYDKLYQNKYEQLYNFFLENEKYDCLTEDLSSIKEEVFMDNVILGKHLGVDHWDKYKRLLDYAFHHDQSLLNESKTDLSTETITKYILLDHPIPTPLIKNIRDSCRRSMQMIKDYAMANLDKFVFFITLTFASKENIETHQHFNLTREESDNEFVFIYVDDPTDMDECNDKKTKFLNNLKKKLKKRDLELYYLGVPEFQENGNVHYHFLMSYIPEDLLFDLPSWLDYDNQSFERRFDKGFIHWKYGKSTVELIKDKNRITTYLSKYLLKSITNLSETDYLERLNKQRFYPSMNLTKPDVKINEDYREDYDDLFYSNYQNVFNRSETERILFSLNEVE